MNTNEQLHFRSVSHLEFLARTLALDVGPSAKFTRHEFTKIFLGLTIVLVPEPATDTFKIFSHPRPYRTVSLRYN